MLRDSFTGLTFSRRRERDAAWAAGYLAFLYTILSLTLSSADARNAFTGAFLPLYVLSLAALWRRRATVPGAMPWFVGLACGWLGPLLVFVFVGPDSAACDGLVPFSECVYYRLFLSDGLITFPLCFVGSLLVAMDDPHDD